MNWLSKDKQYIWHPFTPQKESPWPVFIEKARGSWLYDDSGNRYLDAISSWWVNIHGHSHPYIAEKLYQQALTLEHIIFAGFTHRPAIELAERLLPKLPGRFAKIFYSDNGSTSTEVALKMALQYWWNLSAAGAPGKSPVRSKVLAFNNSYHGDTFGAMSVSDRSVFTMAFHDLLFEVMFIDTPTTENIDQLIQTVRENGEHIAAFIYEPLVQGAGGMKIYEAALMNELLQAVQEKEIICIADEVMTGFGRTGRMFASEYISIKPDIICLSKGLTGGTMPLGVTACTDRIYQAYVTEDRKKTFFHGHSFTANPLACTAALASLDLMEMENTMQRVGEISAANQQFLRHLRSRYSGNLITNPRVLGTILAFEVNRGENIYLNNVGMEITTSAMDRNVYLRPLGNTVYFMPPYCISDQEYSRLTDVTMEIVDNFQDQGGSLPS